MSFHHTQADPTGWGRRTMRATGCAAALLLALTGCFGGSQSENSSSTPSASSTANHSKYPLPSSTASPTPTKKTEPTVTETQAPAPSESAEAKASESSAPAEAKATPVAAATPTGDTPRAPEKVEAERASAGERCGHIGRKGYLKTGAEIMVLRGTVDCAHALDVLTEYVTTPRADDNTTQHQGAKVQDATCYWNPQHMPEERLADRGAPECTIGEDVAFVARLDNPDAPQIPFLMEPSYYDSGAGYYRFKNDDERTLCELNPADGTLVCERRTGEQTGDGNGAVGRTFAGPVEVTRMNFLTGASEVNTANGSSALHAETTTANTKMMHTWDVVTVPAADGNQLTCFGEIETGSISCHDGNGHTILVRGRHEG